MGKIVIVLITGFVAWLLLKGLLKSFTKPNQQPNQSRDKTKEGKAVAPEQMVKCGVCGVFMPESDTVSRDGMLTCRQPEQCPQRARGA